MAPMQGLRRNYPQPCQELCDNSAEKSLIVDMLYRSAWDCPNSPLHQDFLPHKNHSTFCKPGTQNPTILPVRAGAAVKIRPLLYKIGRAHV